MGKRLFLDMDGTIARFHDSILDSEGQVQIELMYEKDFFRKLEPFQNMIDAMKLFIKNHPECEVYSLSAAQLGDPPGFVRQKDEWLDEFLPEIDRAHRIYPECGKAKSGYIPGGVSMVDYLLDDFNKNLREWVRDGGKSIKCKNNINHKGLGKFGGNVGNLWTGDMVSNLDSPEEILKQMEDFMGLEHAQVKSTDIYKKMFENITKDLPSSRIGSFNEEKEFFFNMLNGWKQDSSEMKEILLKRLDNLVWVYGMSVQLWKEENPSKEFNLSIENELREKAMVASYSIYLQDVDLIKSEIKEYVSIGGLDDAQEKFLNEHISEVMEVFEKEMDYLNTKYPVATEPPEEVEKCIDKAIFSVAGKEIIMITASPLKDNYPNVEIDISRRDLERVLLEVYKDDEKWSIEDFLMEYTWDNGDDIKYFIEGHPEFCQDPCKVTDFSNAKYAVIITNHWEHDEVEIYNQSLKGLYPETIDELFMKGLIEAGFEGSRILVTDIENPTWDNVIFDGVVDMHVFDEFKKVVKEKVKGVSLDDKLKKAAGKCGGSFGNVEDREIEK